MLLIYAGWSVDATPFTQLRCPGYDIAVVHDYSTIEPVEIDGYGEVVVLAWSLGVHAAELTCSHLPLTLTIAVNGTPYPVDDRRGIPTAIYEGTAGGLNERALLKFRHRMGAPAIPRGPRPIANLQTELLGFPRGEVDFRWDRAIISAADRIFPPQNQREAWQGRAEILEIDGGHMPDFQSIIDRFVINKPLVGTRFAKGSATYDGSADTQHKIAERLFSLWRKHGLRAGTVLEIGAGTGYFTDLYRPHVGKTILWDIAPARDDIVGCDAEAALPLAEIAPDVVASASTMQWFNSPAAFLRQCARIIRQGGMAVLSTFGPETFKELTAAGVIPLPYLSENALRRIIPEEFEILELRSELTTMEFDSPIEVLTHLKSTGVNARPCSCPIRELLGRYPRNAAGRCILTYQPIYIVLKRK